MDYLIKRFYINQELRKLKAGSFYENSEEERLRARYLSEIQDILSQIQHRGVLVGLCLIYSTVYPLSLIQKLSVVLVSREISTFFYIDEILSSLELENYTKPN